ncbi:MAG: hypothetical protein HY916_04740 [Desulfovibrio sp.]|nr:hypothetical protein [Desulfovibrio sp.]
MLKIEFVPLSELLNEELICIGILPGALRTPMTEGNKTPERIARNG